MRKRFFTLLATTLQSVLWFCPAYGLDNADAKDVRALKRLYESGQYAAAIERGERITKSTPGNTLTHYYLANSYLVTGQLSYAEREYRICVQLEPYSEAGENAQMALLAIGKLKDLKQTQSIVQQKSASDFEEKVARKAEELKQASVNTEVSRLNRRLREEDERIKNLNDEKQRAIDQVPKYIIGAFGARVPNPDYDSEVQVIQAETNSKVEKIQRIVNQLLAERAKILRSGSQLSIEVQKGLKSSTAGSNENVRLMPIGSGLYVRNYVIFSDEAKNELTRSIEPLKGRAERLDEKTLKRRAKK